MKGLTVVRAFFAVSLLFGAVSRVDAQSDTVRSAVALKDAGRFNDAIALLRPYLASHPENGDAARLLSLLLYWVHDIGAARAVADSSLALHSEDTSLRLQYATMLIEIGDGTRATVVLTPVVESPQRGRALGLLGTLSYWQGDLTKARALFNEALRAQPDQPEIRRQLGAILETSAPWVGAETEFRHDDQPITSATIAADAGWFLTPLARVGARVDATYFSLGDSAAREQSTAEVSVSDHWPRLRTSLEFAAGALERSFGSSTDWRGRAALSVQLPSHLTATVRGERAPYNYTLASLATPVMTNTATALLHLDTPAGWLGEASIATQRFPDANGVTSAYAWSLAPLVHRPSGTLQLGYSLAWQDAAQSRFVLTRSVQSGPVANPRFDFVGQYIPYYTPQNLTSHSVLAAASVGVSHATTFHANASYGIHAVEDATTFHAGPPANVTAVVTRQNFTPWDAGAGIDIVGHSALTFSSSAQITHTAFYTAASVVMRVAYRFDIAARREAQGF